MEEQDSGREKVQHIDYSQRNTNIVECSHVQVGNQNEMKAVPENTDQGEHDKERTASQTGTTATRTEDSKSESLQFSHNT